MFEVVLLKNHFPEIEQSKIQNRSHKTDTAVLTSASYGKRVDAQ